jgi:hypothetical protein
MKYLIHTSALAFALALGPIAWAADPSFRPLTEAPKTPDEEFFKVVNGESKVEGHVIKQLVVKPEYLTASYKNDSKESLFPKYTVRIYNRYGFLLGSGRVGAGFFSGSPKLEMGDVGGEKIHLDLVDIAPVFKHTKLELPEDFFNVAWVSLADTNTKLAEKADTGQPAPAPESKSEDRQKPQTQSEGNSR